VTVEKGMDPASVAATPLGSLRWARTGITLLLTAVVAAAFWPTTRALIADWRDTATMTYTHGFLVAAISVWLLIRSGAALESAVVRCDYRAAIVLGITSILWLIAYRAGLQVLHQALLPAIGLLAIWTALGGQVARQVAFAFGFLYFAIPLWSLGNGLLQETTVVAVGALLKLTGIPAYVVGNDVLIPAGTFEIAGGCSGLHFFVVATAIAALYGELQRDTLRIRLALIAGAAALAMVGNWLRVFTIIVAGHLTEMHHFLIKDHYYFGWGLFAVLMAVFFVIARRLPPSSEPAHATSPLRGGFSYAGVVAACVAMIIGPAWSLAVATSDAEQVAARELPTNPGAWRGPLVAGNSWQPHFPGADAQQHVEYRSASSAVEVYIATYASQRQGKELVGFDNSILDARQDSLLAEQRVAHEGFEVNEIEADRSGRSALIWYRYEIGSRQFARGIAAQLQYGVTSLAGAPTSRLLALRTDCVPDCAAVRPRLVELLQTLQQIETGEAARSTSN